MKKLGTIAKTITIDDEDENDIEEMSKRSRTEKNKKPVGSDDCQTMTLSSQIDCISMSSDDEDEDELRQLEDDIERLESIINTHKRQQTVEDAEELIVNVSSVESAPQENGHHRKQKQQLQQQEQDSNSPTEDRSILSVSESGDDDDDDDNSDIQNISMSTNASMDHQYAKNQPDSAERDKLRKLLLEDEKSSPSIGTASSMSSSDMSSLNSPSTSGNNDSNSDSKRKVVEVTKPENDQDEIIIIDGDVNCDLPLERCEKSLVKHFHIFIKLKNQ